MDFNHFVFTAGVYVLVDGYFVFQVGPTTSGKTLGIARIGGHRQGEETGWECAAREALEEACLHVHPLHPPATYWGSSAGDYELQKGTWCSSMPSDVVPLLITKRNEQAITPIYLASSQDDPYPAAEAKALLLLRPCDVEQLTKEPMTLSDYIERGGKAVFREVLPQHLILEPLAHLRWLHIFLHLHPEIQQLSTEL